MIECCKFHIKINQLSKQKEHVCALFAKDIMQARNANKPLNEIQSLESERSFEVGSVDEKIAILFTNYLTLQARRNFVPIPSHDVDGLWNQCRLTDNRNVLTNKGINELKTLLRLERKGRVELFLMISAALTGIIGAISGLIAVIMK